MNHERDNNRETGARRYPVDPEADPHPSDSASVPERKRPYGLTEKVGDVHDKTRQSDAQDQRR